LSSTVFITGVGGFLGRYVAGHFAREGWRVLGTDDLPPENVRLGQITYRRMTLPNAALRDWWSESPPDVLVHCAGRASVGLSLDDPLADYRSNAVMVFELLETLHEVAPRCRFLLLSSAAVYGNPASLPVTEESSVAPLSPYGFHKRQAELICEEFSRVYSLRTACVRIFSAYGPGLRRQVVWDICEKALRDVSLVLQGSGHESRDFIHAADVAAALHLLATAAPCHGEVYNLASGRETTIAELAGRIIEALGRASVLEFDQRPTPGNPLNWRADINKIGRLGFAPSISLEQGVKAVAAWCSAELSS